VSSTSLHAIAAELSGAGLTVALDAPFGALTTYGVGGTAAVLVEITGAADARAVGRAMSSHPGIPVCAFGNGSNTLVSDDGFAGLAVRTRPGTSPDGMAVVVRDSTVTVPAWMPLPVLARRSVAAGACGLEWAVGVPGTVGGAVRMNAGGHGAEIVDSLVSVEVVSLHTGESATFDAHELALHFRGSALGHAHCVVSATFRVGAPDGHECDDALAEIVAWRREHQPGGRNAGSVFVNPAPGSGSSGALIDGCGLRGRTVGGATVSDKHANFIQASPGATASDIIGLMTLVQDEVRGRTGITLLSEVRLVGFTDAVIARFADSSHESVDVRAARSDISRRLGERS
jgi:UDP-N-acetylmuramate dehydrogenase